MTNNAKTISPSTAPIKGTVNVPGDKSISHRSIMFGALSKGDTHVTNFLMADDCLSTIDCFRKMGISIDVIPELITVHGKGLHGLTVPSDTLYTGNSGTTTRLISGILAAQDFNVRLTGDASIEKRPMKRIMTPLSMMGADIKSERENGCAPLLINGTKLHGIDYVSPVASAQVKSSILLAGLYAEGTTSVTEPALSRNHTELMLRGFGADVSSEGLCATIQPADELHACDVSVPSDISSAAYFIAAALLVPGSELMIKNVGINPTRAGIVEVVKNMGGRISLENVRTSGGEETADLLVRYSRDVLKGTTISGDIIPTLIDEIPVIAVLAALADGQTVIKDAAELHVKECDRIDAVSTNMKKLGVDITPTEDGMIINGSEHISGGVIESCNDHRIAMSFAIAALAADSDITIINPECVSISWPGFFGMFEELRR
ncbi:MAG: 3-phosphoshikimate 1-carboxyvinyltransferase [Lachnospiraceae bacterium]|nr:3-phosphoshikimate 1-carboxyvinyltransferase [Lachnospiraceae bacterium]